MENAVKTAEGLPVQEESMKPRVSAAGIRKRVTSNVNMAALSVIIQQFVIVLIAIVASIALIVFFALNGKEGTSLLKDAGVLLAITGISAVAADIVAALFIAKTVKLKGLKKSFRAPAGGILDLILPAFAVAGCSQIIATLLMLIPIFNNSNDALGKALNIDITNPLSVIAGVLYLVILAPVLEEILCRGMILRVGSSISNKFGLILSALLFSFMHMNFLQGVNTFVMGLILGYITIKSGSIIPAIIAHIFNNGIAVGSIFVEGMLGEAVAEKYDLYLPYVLGALGVVSVIILLVRHKKLDEANDRSLESNIRVSDEMIEEAGVRRDVIAKYALSRSWAFWVILGLFTVCGIGMLFLQTIAHFMLNR